MSTDATQVSGSPLSGEGPRPGDVLAERYELLELIDLEGPSHGYRALDQETERVVLVRILAGAGLHTDECDALVDRLQGMLGVGGRYLSSLLDADRERRSPFTVEGWPPGMQLSAILDGRRGRGQVLGAREALPVVARLDAALTALPDGWAHGDVRPERVWLDADGLRLTTPYLLTALPHDELTDRVADLGPGAMAYAPELATKAGRPSPASDRWGVASIAWEALTGRSVDPGSATPEISPALREALLALLHPEPDQREGSLRPLLAALASEARLQVPEIDPEIHRPPTARISPRERRMPKPRAIAGAAAEGTQEVSFDQILEERPAPRPRKIAGAAAEGTQEISFDQIEEDEPLEQSQDSLDPRLVRAALGVQMDSLELDSQELDSQELDSQESGPTPDDTAKHASISEQALVDADSIDPRLLRAALDVQMDSADSQEISQDGLDPRLVRAALGVEMDSLETDSLESDSDLEELPSEELELVPPERPERAARSVPAPKPFPTPKPMPAGAAAKPMPAPKPMPAAQAPRPMPAPKPMRAPKPMPAAQARPIPAPKPMPAAQAPKPTPAPKPAAQPTTPAPRPMPAAQPAPSPGASTPAPRPQPMAAPQPSRARAQHDTPRPSGTAVVSRSEVRGAPSKKKSMAGLLIVAGALFLAIAIVGLGFLIANHRRDEATRQRQIEERLEQLRIPQE